MSEHISKQAEPTLPDKPEVFSIDQLEKATIQYPFWLSGNPNKTVSGSNVVIDYESENQYAVAIRQLMMEDVIKYRHKFGVLPEVTLQKVHWVMDAHARSRDIITEMAKPEVQEDEEKMRELQKRLEAMIKPDEDDPQTLITPYGKVQNIEFEMGQLVAFIGACGGRIVGEDAHGYITEHASYEEVLSKIPTGALLNSLDSEGTLLWFRITEIAGLFKPNRDAAGTPSDVAGEQGNSVGSNKGEKRVRSRSR